MLNVNETCQRYLSIVYENAGFDPAKDKNNFVTETYGELTYEGTEQLLYQLDLTANDVFYDLGSGVGKLVLQVFLNSPVKKACGIEISPSLHQKALRAAERVSTELPEFFETGRSMDFLLGDIFATPFTDASVVLFGSPCYGHAFATAIGEIINNTPSIHTVLALRPINNLKRLRFKQAVRINCSWDAALCYIYR